MGGRRRDQGEILTGLRTGQTLSVAAASSRSSSPGPASPADVIGERLSRHPKTTPAYARRLQIVCRLRGGPQGRTGLRRGQRDQDDLAALAAHAQDTVTVLLAQVADDGTGGFEDPQARQPEHGDQREVMAIPGLTRSGQHGLELQVG